MTRKPVAMIAIAALMLGVPAAPGDAGQTVPETVIRGVVRDPAGRPLVGAQLYVRGSQTLETTGGDGRFELRARGAGAQVLVAFATGFWLSEVAIDLDGALHDIDIVLEPADLEELVDVVASAPVAAAPSVQAFGPLDVVTLPGAQADVMLYVQNLSGVSQLNDEAGLFVRGGDSTEVLTLLDDAVVHHPYRYETVTGGMRGTVDPFLTSDISFSSGGFPARFGNALSGVLEMQGHGRPAEPAGQAALLLSGVSGVAALPVRARGGLRVSGNWSETGPMFRLNRSPRAFTRYPDSRDLNVSGHYDSPALGSFKVFAMSLRERVGIEIEDQAFTGFVESANANALAYARWEKATPGGWLAVATFGVTEYMSDASVGVLDIETRDRRHSWRADVSRITPTGTVRVGTDGGRSRNAWAGRVPETRGDLGGVAGSSVFDVTLADRHAGAYAEIEGRPGVLVPSLGVRVDRFHLARATTVDPRLGLLVRAGARRRLRLAWGLYRQAAPASYYELARGPVHLAPMRAEHWVAGYESGSAGDVLQLTAETYHKRYRNLPIEDADGFSSGGHGSAYGVDLSARVRWPGGGVEAVYGWLRARRRWTSIETPPGIELAEGTWAPYFEIPHGFRATVELELTETVDFAASWRTASGRPFTPVGGARLTDGGHVPVWGAVNSARTPRYERLDVNVSVLGPFGREGLILFAGVTNLLGRHNVLDYAWSPDFTERRPVTSAMPRAVYFGSTVLLR